MPKVVLDTNVYISAIIFDGKPGAIIDLAREGEIEVYISRPMLREIEETLRDKFNQPQDRIQQILLDIKGITKFTNPKVAVSEIKNYEPDNRILECAVQEKVDYLVTGDTKHLQPLKEYKGIKIVSPPEFLDQVT